MTSHEIPGGAARLPVTPVVLTWNEEDNLARTLDALAWADTVLVVDSGSTDTTESIARARPNVTFAVHPFESHGAQWAFAVAHAAVTTPYVLALDADMVVSPAFVRELAERFLPGGPAGGLVGFEYVVGGRALLGSLYPPDLRLFDRSRVRIAHVGHSHRFEALGPVYRFRERLRHDDRKSLERFVAAQMGYARREEERIRRGERLRLRDRLRRLGMLAPAIFLLAWLRAGGPLRGRAALRYAHERALYEALLALRLLGGPGAEGRGVLAPNPERPPAPSDPSQDTAR
jgi:glycosyltransferase involved in cell wall biosynthesis